MLTFTLTPSEKNYGQIEEQVLAMAMTLQWRNSTNTSLQAILHCPQIIISYCPFSAQKSIPTYSTNLLTPQNSGAKIRKANNFRQAVGRSVNVSIDTENDTQSIPGHSIRNIPLIPNQIPHELAKDPILQKAIDRVLRKFIMANCWTNSIVSRHYLFMTDVCWLRRESGSRNSTSCQWRSPHPFSLQPPRIKHIEISSSTLTNTLKCRSKAVSMK